MNSATSEKIKNATEQIKAIFDLPSKNIEILAKAQPQPEPPFPLTNSRIKKGGVIGTLVRAPFKISKFILYNFIKIMLWPLATIIASIPEFISFAWTYQKVVIATYILILQIIILKNVREGQHPLTGIETLLRKTGEVFTLSAASKIATAPFGGIPVNKIQYLLGGNGNGKNQTPHTVDEFKEQVQNIEGKIESMTEDDQKKLIEYVKNSIRLIVPTGEITTQSVYDGLLKKLNEWYFSSNTKPQNTKLTTGLFKTRNNAMRALNKTPLLRTAIGLGPAKGGKQNQKTRKQRK